jgi:hypothetical protein
MRRHAAIKSILLSSGILASCLLACGARADIWKWVDAQGHAQYSDRWTPGAVLIKGERGHESDASGPSDEQAKLDASNRRIDDELDKEAAQRAVQKDQASARAEQCKRAKDHYQKVIEARRIYREDKSGERTYLTDDEADKERVQARLDMQTACGPNGS